MMKSSPYSMNLNASAYITVLTEVDNIAVAGTHGVAWEMRWE